MFYCSSCAERNQWPKTRIMLRMRCPVCGKVALCHEVETMKLLRYLKGNGEKGTT